MSLTRVVIDPCSRLGGGSRSMHTPSIRYRIRSLVESGSMWMSLARIRTASVIINCTSRMIGADSACNSPSFSPRSTNSTSDAVNSCSIESTDSDSDCSVYDWMICLTCSRDASTQSTSMFSRNRIASTDSRSSGSVIATVSRPSWYSSGTIWYSFIIASGTISMTVGLMVAESRATNSMSNCRARAFVTSSSVQAECGDENLAQPPTAAACPAAPGRRAVACR